MTQSVYERVLGSDFELLAPELRAYFSGGHGVGVGGGVFEVAGCRLAILRPVLAYLARQRILFPEFARAVPFDIVNTPTASGELDALRTFHLPARDRPLEDGSSTDNCTTSWATSAGSKYGWPWRSQTDS